MNTPRLITDSNGNAVWQWGQDEPFGDTIPNQDPNGTGNQFVFNFRHRGQYADVETGLFYNYFRYYDPALGIYYQSDLIGLAAGQASTYVYVGGNPLKGVDPFGLYNYDDLPPSPRPPSPDPNGVVPGGPWTPEANGQRPGTYLGPKQPQGGRSRCQYVPDQYGGGTRGAKDPYWKVNQPGQKGWQRYSTSGDPITPEEAHPMPTPEPVIPEAIPEPVVPFEGPMVPFEGPVLPEVPFVL